MAVNWSPRPPTISRSAALSSAASERSRSPTNIFSKPTISAVSTAPARMAMIPSRELVARGVDGAGIGLAAARQRVAVGRHLRPAREQDLSGAPLGPDPAGL